MADAIAPAVAPTNGAPPTTPQKPAAPVKPTAPVKAAEPVDDSEEYVVDGKPVRLTKAQRALHFQKALAADKRMKEAADLRKANEDFLREFEEDPEAALAKRGKDPNKLIAAHLEKKAKLELMTEEQRRIAAAEAERDKAKSELEETRKAKAAEAQAALDKQNWQRVETGLLAAADKYGLAGEPKILEELADIGLEFLEYGVEITPDQIAEEYQRRDREHIEAKDKRLHSVLKGEKLLKYLGDGVLAEIQAALKARDAASLNDIPKPQAKIKVQAHERAVRPKSGHINENDFDAKFLK